MPPRDRQALRREDAVSGARARRQPQTNHLGLLAVPALLDPPARRPHAGLGPAPALGAVGRPGLPATLRRARAAPEQRRHGDEADPAVRFPAGPAARARASAIAADDQGRQATVRCARLPFLRDRRRHARDSRRPPSPTVSQRPRAAGTIPPARTLHRRRPVTFFWGRSGHSAVDSLNFHQ